MERCHCNGRGAGAGVAAVACPCPADGWQKLPWPRPGELFRYYNPPHPFFSSSLFVFGVSNLVVKKSGEIPELLNYGNISPNFSFLSDIQG